MSNNDNVGEKEELAESKRAKVTPKRKIFRSFSLGKSMN